MSSSNSRPPPPPTASTTSTTKRTSAGGGASASAARSASVRKSGGAARGEYIETVGYDSYMNNFFMFAWTGFVFLSDCLRELWFLIIVFADNLRVYSCFYIIVFFIHFFFSLSFLEILEFRVYSQVFNDEFEL